MIAASEPHEFVPFGRQHMKKHPGAVVTPSKQDQRQCEGLTERFNQVRIEDSSQDEWWTICGGSQPPLNVEKELYVSGKTAVVSVGSVGLSVAQTQIEKSSGRMVKVSYTLETPIHQALFCNFLDNDSKPLPSLCLIENDKISVFVEDGQDFTAPLQFKVAAAWPTKYGLLLERVARYNPDRNNYEELTTLFSLLHPLDEISPILCVKQGGVLSYMNDAAYKVVFTCDEPSICLLYDVRTGLHSVWKIRWALSDECEGMCVQPSLVTMNTSAASSNSNLSGVRPSAHLRLSTTANKSLLASGSSSRNSSSASHFNGSPFGPQMFKSQCSSVSSSKASLSGVHLSRISTASSEARLGCSIVAPLGEPKPIIPEVCLEYLWTETSSSSMKRLVEGSKGSRKSFLVKDVIDQEFLCYIVGDNSLVMVRLGRTNTRTPEPIICTVSYLLARDAVPIPALKMLAVLEPGGCVMLYTGVTPVGKLHIGGVSAEQANVSYLNAASSVCRINSPFPRCLTSTVRRPVGSVMSSTRVGDAYFDDAVHLLSPVPSSFTPETNRLISPSVYDSVGDSLTCSEGIQSLRDPVASRFTLEFHNGQMFRFTMPELCTSPLVTECLKVLKCVLQKDVALLTISKWYTVRNAPGTQDISPKHEWQLFIVALMGLLGYQLDSLPLVNYYLNSDCDTPAKNTKKMRSSDTGSNDDWNYVINSSYHSTMMPRLTTRIGVKNTQQPKVGLKSTCKPETAFNKNSPLFPYIHLIMFPLHLLYEEMKLSSLFSDSLPLLVRLLHQLAKDLRLESFASYYERDFPSECLHSDLFESQLTAADLENLDPPPYMKTNPCSVFEHILTLIQGERPASPYPFIAGVNPLSRNVIEIVGILTGLGREHVLWNIVPPGSRSVSFSVPDPTPPHEAPTQAHEAVLLMAKLGMTREDIVNLPCGVGLFLASHIQTVTENPCQGWPAEACRLISRLDLVPDSTDGFDRGSGLPRSSVNVSEEGSPEQLAEEILKLRFNKDQRVAEVKRLLQSSEPVTIGITQRPEVSDHEFIEEQERHLYAICTRTMALPVGRGMMDLHNTVTVIITEQLDIPKLCLSGRVPPRGTTVELSHIEVVPNMNLWPLFHNGVAAGLKISPRSKQIDSTWILYNKPKNGVDSLPEHAGFLMALGLSGHLNNLMLLHLYNYLNKLHEMTSVGVLLGLAASKRGTMDVRATKIFSLHIESLLPPTSIELDLVQNIQVAALLGIGLVYQGTGHRHIAESLLSEIGRPPGPEMENSCDREGYSLAAGLGLGLVMLGKGSDPTGLADHDIADTLQYYMVGGHRRPLTGSQKEKYKSPSYQIREGDCVNNHVTGPGATLALGMMYFNTENIAVATWLSAPESEYMLDFVSPHQLLLRTLARGLVLWNSILPNRTWIESHVPSTIRPYCLTKPRPDLEHVDLETMNQGYCNIVAGACMALGLRFAGTANNQAFETLFHYCKLFTTMSNKSIADLAGKSTIETCICVTLLSLATVMAGTGDLDVLRLCRHLGSRVGQATNSVVTYGSHLAVHMALGLLFLGGGALSLSNSPESVAAMICAFFPRFPTHSNDNRYHLQAFRHLYVLAIEPRLFLPRDIDSGSLCYAHLHLTFEDTKYYKNQSVRVFAPCLLPHLELLSEVRVEDDRYWPIVFSRRKNWDQLERAFKKRGSIGIKLRAGCLPYVEDPKGYKSLLAQTLSTETSTSWSISTDSILPFISDQKTHNFVKYFLEPNGHQTERELALHQWLSIMAYECVTGNKLPLLDFWVIILGEVMRVGCAPSTTMMWQLKLVFANTTANIQTEHTLALKQYVNKVFSEWYSENQDLVAGYVRGEPLDSTASLNLMFLMSYLTFYDFPFPAALPNIRNSNFKSMRDIALATKGRKISFHAIRRIWSVYSKGIESGS